MIWLIGNKGMLGSEIARQLEFNNINFIGTDRDVDITNIDSLRSFINNIKNNSQYESDNNVTWIINCSAYTAVDKAEEEFELATLINEIGVKNIATIAKENNSRLIHISTDYVFDGNGTRPYLESDSIAPIGAYGLTKANGEKAAQAILKELYIVRTAWLYGYNGNNFVYTMLKLMNNKSELSVVNDQIGSPTFASDLAYTIIMIMLSRGLTEKSLPTAIDYGIYHCTDIAEISWYDFAKAIYKIGKEKGKINSDCIIKSCTTEEYPTKTKRPSYSVLSKEKIQKALNFQLPDWYDSLKAFIASPLFKTEKIK